MATTATSASRIISRFLFWAAVLVSFGFAITPHPPVIPGHPSDKLEHIFAFVVLSALGVWAYPNVRKRIILLGLAGYGALIEMAQSIPVLNRDSDIFDWFADVGASLSVLVIVALWTWWKMRQPRR